jgi:hypothetical protein
LGRFPGPRGSGRHVDEESAWSGPQLRRNGALVQEAKAAAWLLRMLPCNAMSAACIEYQIRLYAVVFLDRYASGWPERRDGVAD